MVWRFIAPSAPWWGGWWERLIGSVKSGLRTVRQRSLTRVELESTLHEVEAWVNSRPLSFVEDELDSGSPLTPPHFLIGRPVVCKPTVGSIESVGSITREDLSLRQELRDQTIQSFWSSWVDEYIRGLPVCRGSRFRKSVREGSVVLIRGCVNKCYCWRFSFH